MVEEKKWYRVTDPLSPLFGCDVRGWVSEAAIGPDNALVVEAMRRIDVFVGDRPFQLVATPGENLGLAVRTDQLEESPLQDDIIELTTDSPYGKCVDEEEATRADDLNLHVTTYERAIQVALRRVLHTRLGVRLELLKTITIDSYSLRDEIQQMFEDGRTADEIVEYMVTEGEANGR